MASIGGAGNHSLSLGRAHQCTGGYWPQGREIIWIVEEGFLMKIVLTYDSRWGYTPEEHKVFLKT